MSTKCVSKYAGKWSPRRAVPQLPLNQVTRECNSAPNSARGSAPNTARGCIIASARVSAAAGHWDEVAMYMEKAAQHPEAFTVEEKTLLGVSLRNCIERR